MRVAAHIHTTQTSLHNTQHKKAQAAGLAWEDWKCDTHTAMMMAGTNRVSLLLPWDAAESGTARLEAGPSFPRATVAPGPHVHV